MPKLVRTQSDPSCSGVRVVLLELYCQSCGIDTRGLSHLFDGVAKEDLALLAFKLGEGAVAGAADGEHRLRAHLGRLGDSRVVHEEGLAVGQGVNGKSISPEGVFSLAKRLPWESTNGTHLIHEQLVPIEALPAVQKRAGQRHGRVLSGVGAHLPGIMRMPVPSFEFVEASTLD